MLEKGKQNCTKKKKGYKKKFGIAPEVTTKPSNVREVCTIRHTLEMSCKNCAFYATPYCIGKHRTEG